MLILLSACACLCYAYLCDFYYALCLCRYVLVFTFTMLSFHRETRKADMQEKHFELVETLLVSFSCSHVPQLSSLAVMKAKQRMLGV